MVKHTCEIHSAVVASVQLFDGHVGHGAADFLESQLHGVRAGGAQLGLIHIQGIHLPCV